MKAMAKAGLPGGKGDNKWVWTPRPIHDPESTRAPQLTGFGLVDDPPPPWRGAAGAPPCVVRLVRTTRVMVSPVIRLPSSARGYGGTRTWPASVAAWSRPVAKSIVPQGLHSAVG